MSGKALLTGVSGFIGSHLAEYLLQQGVEVYGTRRPQSSLDNIEHIASEMRLMEADMRDAPALERAVSQAQPEYIFHLAALSYPLASWQSPVETMEINAIGTINLFEAIRKKAKAPRILVAGSSEEYGLAYPEELPAKETNPLRPLSPYAVSKIAQDKLSYQYHKSYGLDIVVTRSFNTTGPRQSDVYVVSNFARQIAQIEAGEEPVIRVGNLKAQRDFSDVRDSARAYWLALQKCQAGEVYNICSQKARTVQEVLELLLSFSQNDIRVKQDPSRTRLAEGEALWGDCSKFKQQTGWEPVIPWEKTLKDLLDYWRQRLKDRR